MISEGCKIEGKVVNSILSGGVIVEKEVEIYDSVIMEDVKIGRGARVYTSIIDSCASVAEFGSIGIPHAGKNNITVIANGAWVTGNTPKQI
jgi:glucose-1-phosphate adenylyltransferase